ncbi:hypothetical protein TrVE_jg3753 [Triparma verrucosa]|uniref:Uncharacterized protein n=1 Tax=Triparma verrucosa TaxID=1606542 RepID=A0A9W7B840_9STRA|nr:hypothetical protein TrVE_jg3753 [Triparma verrucosa]
MVKSGEVRAKYEAEIKELKNQIASAPDPSDAPLATTTTVGGLVTSAPPGTNLALTQKIAEYQSFVSKYVVDAQMEKYRAVQEAEQKVKAYYEGKIAELTGGSPPAPAVKAVAPAPAPAAPAAPAAAPSAVGGPGLPNPKLFHARNDAVAAAGDKGRWVQEEVDKANSAPSSSAPASAGGSADIFAARNAAVAKAGKSSRWIDEEVTKAEAMGNPSVPFKPDIKTAEVSVPKEVKDADHGMRADGGVGGPSLAERVNFGSKLLSDDEDKK